MEDNIITLQIDISFSPAESPHQTHTERMCVHTRQKMSIAGQRDIYITSFVSRKRISTHRASAAVDE
jgi:hypothetical protein